ncbi:MAG TPA: hypothetical protein VF596_07100 [Pyrinomonadaceae bacterium]
MRERAEESTSGVSKEERGGIGRRLIRAVDPLNTRSPKVYPQNKKGEKENKPEKPKFVGFIGSGKRIEKSEKSSE